MDVTTHMPDLRTRPLTIEILLNKIRICAFSLIEYSWLDLRVPVPDSLSRKADGKFEIEILANRTWQPRPAADETRDDRELSIAVCNIVIQ
jgi:hypothetical protein